MNQSKNQVEPYPGQQPGTYPPPDPAYPPPPPTDYTAPPAYQSAPAQPAQPVYTQSYGQATYTSGNTVVVTQPYRGPGMVGGMPDNTGAIIYSCAVAWCCCIIFGIIAFFYAFTARDSGDEATARRKLQISMRYSTVGLVVGVMLYIIGNVIRVTLAVAL